MTKTRISMNTGHGKLVHREYMRRNVGRPSRTISSIGIQVFEKLRTKFVDAISSGEVDDFMTLLKAFIASIPYDLLSEDTI